MNFLLVGSCLEVLSPGLYQSFFGSQPHKKEKVPLAKNLNSRR